MAEWGEPMSDVEFEAAGPDVTPPLEYDHDSRGAVQAPAMGKRTRDQPLGAASGDGYDDMMHDRIKRLNIGRERTVPRMVWHGSAEISQIASVDPHAARHEIARMPSFDAQAEREMVDNTYTCVNRLLGKLHDERQIRRRRRPSQLGMDQEDSGDESL